MGGGVVAFYESPSSELGQPRAHHNHGDAWGSGSNGILVTGVREKSCMACAYCVSTIEGGLLWIPPPPLAVRMPREFVDTTYTTRSRARPGKGCDLGMCLSRGWDNESPYFRRYISVMYNPSWYGNQRFPTCTYDAARDSSVFLTSPSGSPNSTVFLPLLVPTRIPTYLFRDSGGKFAQCPPTGGVVAEIVAVVTVKTLLPIANKQSRERLYRRFL